MLRVNGKFNINTDFACGDKSVSHRALIFAAVADGVSMIRNISLCKDVKATADCLEHLGAVVQFDGTTATVTPIKTPISGATLDCKNSGTTARLLAGLVAGLGVKATFVGDESLSKRPMDRVIDPLNKLGANFCKKDSCLFESYGGKLIGDEIESTVNSAQVKSAVLIAGIFAEGSTTYVEKTPTRNHTELMLSYFKAPIQIDGRRITVRPCSIHAFDVTVPNDVSCVAYPLSLALITKKQIVCRNVLLNERRLGFVRVLHSGGADITLQNVTERFGEKVGDITVKKSSLKPLTANRGEVCDAIDELPLLAAIAVTVKGKHVFCDVSELSRKESDRIAAIISFVKTCGQSAAYDGKNLTVLSNGVLPKNPHFCSFGDHRIAMCETILALVCGGGSVDGTPFDISFPQFKSSIGIDPLKLGLIGTDVQNSLSPCLMRLLAERADVCCDYQPVSLSRNVSDAELVSTIKQYDGLNVTMPFKQRTASLLGVESSVNTLGKNVVPQSSDGYGIVKSLQNNGIDFCAKELWIIGAGGAAEACVRALLPYGCKIAIINRSKSRAEELSEKYGLPTKIDNPYGVLSFVPQCEFEQSIKLPQSCRFVFVAAYAGQSGIKNQAEQRGIKAVDGLEMLYHQGAKSFSLWTNTPVQDDYESFRRCVAELKK